MCLLVQFFLCFGVNPEKYEALIPAKISHLKVSDENANVEMLD